ncbi:MAG: hypothetical protein IT423_03790 [Pirellulaceae bacterium]|nr:hypothetical protein [Pirellulaceae bacterium]
MAFLSGSVGFERFKVTGADFKHFQDEHIEALTRFAANANQAAGAETSSIGFIGGDHLFDTQFFLEKNVIDNALHCAIRVDTNQVPSAIKKAWLQMELLALAKDNNSGRPTKAQRQEAKESVEARCEEAARSGKYHKMSEFPVLWDASQQLLYIGSSSSSAITHTADLFSRAFEIELSRISAGSIVTQWAEETEKQSALDDLSPATFLPEQAGADSVWLNEFAESYDFLGNEFMMWLWWHLETQADTFKLSDETEVTAMFARTLSLECPLGENGKETIAYECPIKLPEAMQAIRAGKLPRKAGLTLVRHNQQFDLTLQAETFAISGAKIQADETEDAEEMRVNRIESIRNLGETVDLLFKAFCDRRVSKKWSSDLDQLTRWLKGDVNKSKKPAA